MLSADIDPKDFETRAAAQLEQAQRALDELLALPSNASFAQVIGGFDAIGRPLDVSRGVASLASQVHPLQTVREAAQRIVQGIAVFSTELSLNRTVYDKLAALDPAQAAGAIERRLLEHALRDYRRSGVDRDEKTRQRIRELSDELVKIGQEFDLNIAKDTRKITIAEGRRGLEGLPGDYVAAHPENERGEVVVTTDPPDYVPFMTYAVHGELRRRLHFEYSNRATPDNVGVLLKIIAKRHETATLLGYANWADYVTEDKMIESAAKARAFIEHVADLARPRLTAEYAELLAAKRESEDPRADAVHDWERAYWAERIKSTKLGFDSQSVRPYFAYAKVRDGVLATSAALYGIEFARNTTEPVWHASVECYDVIDRGAVVARFYLDMHPRPNKYKHGAMFDLRSGGPGRGDGVPEAALVCNFPEPTASDPALLLHRDVTTFFHEFGHLLHHLFAGGQRFLAFSGIATEWDFVEAPSQMYEEWAWDAGVLARFARHHETGAPLPPELVARMREAEEYGKGIQVATQMYLAMLSLTYHDHDPRELDLGAHMLALRSRMLPFPNVTGTHFFASFGHLHGYSAIYYTYMWSLVIAKDLFSRFDGNLMNARIAGDYRRNVLAPGGSRDAAELVRAFLGRDYRTDAWQTWLNR
jgi:thimet oligopeptidase